MADFQDAQLVELAASADEVLSAELVNVDVSPGLAGAPLEQRNLFAVSDLIANRAATPSTRRQYAAIYRSFGDWLGAGLGRPPPGRRP